MDWTNYNMYIQSNLSERTPVVGARSGVSHPFGTRQKRRDMGEGREQGSSYDIRAELALPPAVADPKNPLEGREVVCVIYF